MNGRRLLNAAGAIGVLIVLILGLIGPWQAPALWFTPDQQGDRLMKAGKFAEAAKVYSDPVRQGIAFYRAGDFKAAAASFSHAATPEAVYNHANALVLLGQYAAAVETYDRALSLRPHWKEAEDNRKIALVRRDRLKTKGGDETGGQIDPDQIVYEKGMQKSAETVQVNDGPPLSDSELQALWLRRVQTRPADFLRAKFAYQSAQQSRGGRP